MKSSEEGLGQQTEPLSLSTSQMPEMSQKGLEGTDTVLGAAEGTRKIGRPLN
jgi:hypothetical protein